MFDPNITSMDNPPTNPVGLHHGLTLRDWFAGQAMCGLLACPTTFSDSHERFANDAYRFADAMLAARKVAPPEK